MGGDSEQFKAVDYHCQDDYDESCRIYNVRRCGIYMPGIYWERCRQGGLLRFNCDIAWARVSESGGKHIVDAMKVQFGQDRAKWPDPCCGARFLPWARGASKCVEIKLAEGWVSFLAGGLPEQLEDEIMKAHEAFHQADVRIGPFADELGFWARLADLGVSLRVCPLLVISLFPHSDS